jgi:hypothetical protein
MNASTMAARDQRGLSFLQELLDGRLRSGGPNAAYWLAVGLDRLPALTATALACDWALSLDPERRLTVARALEWTFQLLGDRTLLAHLRVDPDPRVRAAATRAAAARRHEPAG